MSRFHISELANVLAVASKALLLSILRLVTELSRELARILRRVYLRLEAVSLTLIVEILVYLYSIRHSLPFVVLGAFLGYRRYWLWLAAYLLFISLAVVLYYRREKERTESEAAKNDSIRKYSTLILMWILRAVLIAGVAALLSLVVENQFFSGSHSVAAADGPNNFRALGACPFECCTYRDWRSVEPVKVYSDSSRDSKPIETIPSGEWVKALDGYVETSNPGTIRLLKSPTDERYAEYRLRSGDLLHIYHYLGEGCWKTWIQGAMVDFCPPNHEVLDEPSTVWWARVRLGSGEVGWTERADLFENVDACGTEIIKR